MTFSEASLSIASSCGDLRSRWRSSTTSASLISLSGIALFSAAPASIGMNVVSMPMRLAGTPERLRYSVAFFIVSSAPDEFACTSETQSGFTCCWKFSSRWPK